MARLEGACRVKRKFRLAGFDYDATAGKAHFSICIPGTGGKVRRKRTVDVRDRDHAVEEYARFKAELGARKGKATVWTLRTYCVAFDRKLTASLSPAAAKSFRLDVRRLVAVLGEKPLAKITDADVKDAAVALKFAPTTVNHVLSSLRKVLNDATSRKEIQSYPITRRLPTRKAEALSLEMTEEERTAFLAAFDDEVRFRRMLAEDRVVRLEEGRPVNPIPRPDGDAAHGRWALFRASKPLFIVALETGIALSDLQALTWADVAGDILTLRRRKTGVEAVVPISAACREALEEVRSRAVVGHRVFLGPLGKPICTSQVKAFFSMAKSLAGITRRLRFHDLRHTFASRLATAGVPLQVIARALGHSSTRTTERYARPGDETIDLVRSALDTKPSTAPARLGPRSIRNA